MDVSLPVRAPFILMAISLVVLACATRAPFLNPVTPGTDTSSGSKQVVVEIKPVDTSGYQNEERKRLGIDLSAYFTAFEVTIRNQTPDKVTLDGQGAQLSDDEQKSYTVLSAKESLDYYQSGGVSGEKIVIVPKAVGIAKEEMDKILQLRLKNSDIPSGGSAYGILLFQKVPAGKCHQVSLTLNGVRIYGESNNRVFQFTFSCPES
ncbi:MAG TPA: hypothetical protein VMN77_06305 [Nitrospiria bacterium]|jgi:hypothetical protein|nr:hypothetical protein [Nitrospiria bacterium]